LRSERLEIEQRLREFELQKMLRQEEDGNRRARAIDRVQKRYVELTEESRAQFEGKTVLEAVHLFLIGPRVTAEEFKNFLERYAAFRWRFLQGVHMIVCESVLDVSGAADVRTHAMTLLKSMEDRIGISDYSITGIQAAYRKALIDEKQYELLNSLSEAQRIEITKCNLLDRLSPACEQILRQRLQ